MPTPPPLPTLAGLTDWAHQARPVFICGQARSGTSMLQLALGRHPALFAVPDVFETFIFNKPQAPLAKPVPGMLRSYLGGPPGVAGLRELLAALKAAAGAPLSDDDQIRAFFWYAAQHVYGPRRPLEKTPSHVHSLPAIFRIFPQACVLACVRDPAEVLGSYRRRLAREQALGKPEATWAWLAISDDQLMAHLRRVNKALREVEQQHPGRVFQVPYAWITGQPEAALHQICGFIGEAFEPALLEPPASEAQRVKPRVDQRLGQAIGAALPADAQDDDARLVDPAAAQRLRDELPGLTLRWQHVGPLPAAA